MSSKIETKLQALLKVKPKGREDRQYYLGRIVDAADGLEDDQWDELTKDAQKWVNAATKAMVAEKEIPDFPDLEAEDDAEGDAVEETAEEDERPTRKVRREKETEEDEEPPARTRAETRGKRSVREEPDEAEPEEENDVPAKKKSAKAGKSATKTATKKASNGALPMGAPTLIKQMILKKPEIDKFDLEEALKKKGFKTSILTISTVRSDFRNSLRVMKDAGWPKVDI